MLLGLTVRSDDLNSPHEKGPMQELDAMRSVAAALEPLGEESRKRVIAWAASLYGVRVSIVSGQAPSATGVQASGPEASSLKFSTLAELFDMAAPRTEAEKALIGGYWLQKNEGMTTFDSAAVNRELKHLGHAVGNITVAFDNLKQQKPSLAIQTAKSGKSQQARKKYMITKAGEKYIERMLSGEQNGDE